MDKTLRCGFGQTEITPPLGTPIVGYYRQRFTKGVIDPLFARAVLFDNGKDMVMIITLDVCILREEHCTDIRERVSKEIGIHKDAIFVTLSHTHTGPLTGKDFASDLVVDPAYVDYLKSQAVLAGVSASKDLADSKLYYAKTEAKGISFIRRYRLGDGTVKTNPKEAIEGVDSFLGTPNEDARLLKIVRDGAKDIYLVHFGTHADTVGGEYISADWPGYVCSTMEGAIPDSHCMFILGPQGDVNHCNRFLPGLGIVRSDKVAEDYREAAAHARYMGRVIAGQILTVCDKAEEVPLGDISFGKEEIRLPTNLESEGLEEAIRINELYLADRKDEIPKGSMPIYKARRIIRMQGEPEYYPYFNYVLKIGEFVFAGLPGEPFTDIGRRIYAASPFKQMMVCCLTNSSCGYIGTSQAYDEGGYETLTSSYKKGVDNVMVDGMNHLISTLS